MVVAKVVRSASGISIELPKGFPIEIDRLSVRMDGDSIILEPLADTQSWAKVLAWLDARREGFDSTFVAAVAEDPGPGEKRDFHLLD